MSRFVPPYGLRTQRPVLFSLCAKDRGLLDVQLFTPGSQLPLVVMGQFEIVQSVIQLNVRLDGGQLFGKQGRSLPAQLPLLPGFRQGLVGGTADPQVLFPEILRCV